MITYSCLNCYIINKGEKSFAHMYEENNAHKIDKVEVILHSVDLSKEGEELTCKQHKWFLCTDIKSMSYQIYHGCSVYEVVCLKLMSTILDSLLV